MKNISDQEATKLVMKAIAGHDRVITTEHEINDTHYDTTLEHAMSFENIEVIAHDHPCVSMITVKLDGKEVYQDSADIIDSTAEMIYKTVMDLRPKRY